MAIPYAFDGMKCCAFIDGRWRKLEIAVAAGNDARVTDEDGKAFWMKLDQLQPPEAYGRLTPIDGALWRKDQTRE
jgi:hypothetical protein